MSSFFVFPLHFASPFVSKSLNPKNHKQKLTPLDDDPSGEAVKLRYGVTEDVEWCDLGQVTTMGGAFVITMDWTATTKTGMTNGGVGVCGLCD